MTIRTQCSTTTLPETITTTTTTTVSVWTLKFIFHSDVLFFSELLGLGWSDGTRQRLSRGGDASALRSDKVSRWEIRPGSGVFERRLANCVIYELESFRHTFFFAFQARQSSQSTAGDSIWMFMTESRCVTFIPITATAVINKLLSNIHYRITAVLRSNWCFCKQKLFSAKMEDFCQ